MKEFLKKFMLVSMILTVISATAVIVLANGVNLHENTVEILSNQIGEQEITKLTENRKYDSSMSGKKLNGKPILRVYDDIYWLESNKSLPDILAHANSQKTSSEYYLVFGENPFLIKFDTTNNSVSLFKEYHSSHPAYISDIISLTITFKADGEEGKVEEIRCFNDTEHGKGIVLYLKTDRGVFLKFYQTENSIGTLFSEDEFGVHAKDYCSYIYKDNKIGDKNEVDFLTFVQNKQDYIRNTLKNSDSDILIYLVGGALIIIAIGTVSTFVWYRKKHRVERVNIE